MSDRHYSEEKRNREKEERERKDVRRGWDIVSLSGRLYVSNPDHDEKVQ